jgi:uncharacterized membrane protein SpoIIM required for sporulation
MSATEFAREREARWRELRELCDAAGRSPIRLAAASVLRLGELYRATAADLAVARRRFPGHPIVDRLEVLVGHARPLVYARATPITSARDWVTRGYWRRVRERPSALAVAALALFVPMALSGYWAWRDPVAARGLAPAQFEGVTEPKREGDDLGLAADEQAEFSAFIFTNNIRVAALAFGAGVLLGLGSLFLLGYNGLVIGSLFGLAIDAGNGRPLFALVTAHGVLELSCIVVGGAAGWRMGWAFVAPGNSTRGEALRREARAGVEIMLGTSVWLVVAGLIEGFVTPAGLNVASAAAVGIPFGLVYWTLVVALGRAPGARDQCGRRTAVTDVRAP